MHFVLDLGLQVKFFQQARDLFLDVRYFATALDNLILDRLLDSPESVAVFDILEDEFALLSVAEVHVGSAALESWLSVRRGVHRVFENLIVKFQLLTPILSC